MTGKLEITTLGGVSVRLNGERLTGLASRKAEALLLYLALEQRPCSREQLADLLWDDRTQRRALSNLRVLLSSLRKQLGEFVDITRTTAAIKSDANIVVDVLTLEDALNESTPDTADVLTNALERANGEFMAGYFLRDARGFDEWQTRQREATSQLVREALEKLIALHADRHDQAAAVQAAQQLLRLDPIYEAGYLRLMQLYAAQNDRARALHTYHTAVTTLERELGVVPGEPLQRLYEQLYRGKTAVAAIRSKKMKESIRLVGRETELQTLQAAWQRMVNGRSRLVVIEGEAGIGKTRLAEELLEWVVARRGHPAARARTYAAEGSLAFAPVAEWLRADVIRPQLGTLDAAWQSELARLLPELLTDDPAVPAPRSSSSGLQRQRLFEAAARAITADARPMLLLLDDLQWCDAETLEWLHYLLRFEGPAPLLIVGTLRSGEADASHPVHALVNQAKADGRLTAVVLEPLSAAETEALAAHVSGQPSAGSKAERLFAASAGNPLFVVEMVRAGYHEAERNDTGNGGDDAAVPLPPKVQAVIEARLNQLSTEAHKLAQLGAVIGRDFDFDLLLAASGDDEDTVAFGLDELWRRRLVREQGVDGYDFSHDRIRDVAYDGISPVQRRLLHRRVGTALETRHAANADSVSGESPLQSPVPVSGRLAMHFERAGLTDKAIVWHNHAAYYAAEALYSRDLARRHAEAGLALLEELPGNRERSRLKVELLSVMSTTLDEDDPDLLLLIYELATSVGHSGMVWAVFISLPTTLIRQGRITEAQAIAEKHLRTAKRAENENEVANAQHALGRLGSITGEYGPARAALEQAIFVPANDVLGALYRRSFALRYLINVYWSLGYVDRAVHAADEIKQMAPKMQIAATFGVPYFTSILYVNIGSETLLAEQVEAFYDRGEKYELPLATAAADIYRGWLQAQNGKVNEGIALTRQGCVVYDRAKQEVAMPMWWVMLADMHLTLDEWAEAQAALDRGFAISESLGLRFWDAELCRAQGDVLRAQQQLDEAEAAYKRGIAVGRRQEARSLELRSVMALCRLWHAQGKSTQARERLEPIYNWFSEGFQTRDLIAASALLNQFA